MITFSNSKDIDIEKIRDLYCDHATWMITNNDEDWQKILANSSSIMTAWDKDTLIGMARGLSDEVRWATIVDVLVHPDYRGQSIGRQIIEKLLNEEKMQVRTVYLATPDKEDFYSRLGFNSANKYCSYMVKVDNNKEGYFLPGHRQFKIF